MKISSILILSAGLALVLSAPQEISAQPGYPGYSSGSRYRKSSRKEKKSKRTKKDSKKSKGEEEKPPMKAGSGQESINSYVKYFVRGLHNSNELKRERKWITIFSNLKNINHIIHIDLNIHI